MNAEAVTQWLHLMAAIVWLGGMLFTAFVLHPVLRAHLAPSQRGPLMRAIGGRFKWVEAICLVTLLVTGIYRLGGLGILVPAAFGAAGWVLAGKLYLSAAVIVLSSLHNLVWAPRLAAMQPEEAAAASRRLMVWAGANLVFGAAAVFCGALLRTGYY